jgi:hypothetical protein
MAKLFRRDTNIALAVTLTALGSVLCVVTLPTVAAFGLREFLGEAVAIEVPVGALTAQLALSLLLPIGIGMGARARWPEFVARHQGQLQRAVMIAIGALIALAIPFVDTSDMGKLSLADLPHAIAAGVAWAAAAMAIGWGVAAALKLSAEDRHVRDRIHHAQRHDRRDRRAIRPRPSRPRAVEQALDHRLSVAAAAVNGGVAHNAGRLRRATRSTDSVLMDQDVSATVALGTDAHTITSSRRSGI